MSDFAGIDAAVVIYSFIQAICFVHILKYTGKQQQLFFE